MATPADNLDDAFNQLDFHQPVQPEEVKTLFVERPYSPTNKIATHLRVSKNPVKLLFVGHSGAGKSSELSYLTTLLRADFLCIPIPMRRIYQSPAVSHTEVLLAMSLRLLKMAADEQIVPRGALPALWEDWLRTPYRYFRDLLVGPTTGTETEISVSEISLKTTTLVGEFESKLGLEPGTRENVRRRLEDRINETIEQIGEIVTALQQHLKKKILFLVEDLDKFNQKDTCALFLDHSKTLTSPNAHIIYSFPIAMRYTDEFFAIKKDFAEVYILPNIALRHRDGSDDPKGRETMRAILEKRVSRDLFEAGVIDRLVQLSGGHVKSLIQLSQQAVLNALVDDAGRVGDGHVTEAASRLRDDFITRLSPAQIEALKALKKDPDKVLAGLDSVPQSLLYNGSLLEYGNTRGPWGDVNPIVEEILNRDGD